MEPSVFLKTPVRTLEMDPEMDRRYAPGLMYRDHMANA